MGPSPSPQLHGEDQCAPNRETGTHIHQPLEYRHRRSLASFLSLSAGTGRSLYGACEMASGMARTSEMHLRCDAINSASAKESWSEIDECIHMMYKVGVVHMS